MLRFLLILVVGCVGLCSGAVMATTTDTTTLARIDGRNGCVVEFRTIPGESGPLLLVHGLQIRVSTGALAFDEHVAISAIELDTLRTTLAAAQARITAGPPRSHLSGHNTHVNPHLVFSLSALRENDQLVWRPEITLKPVGTTSLRIVSLLPEHLPQLQAAVAAAQQLLH